MDGQATWLSTVIASQQEVRIIKIVLDKGLVAMVLAIGGLVGSVLLERDKSVLKTQAERSRITIPRILEMLTNSEARYGNGLTRPHTIGDAFGAFREWTDALHDTPAQLMGRFRPQDAILLDRNGRIVALDRFRLATMRRIPLSVSSRRQRAACHAVKVFGMPPAQDHGLSRLRRRARAVDWSFAASTSARRARDARIVPQRDPHPVRNQRDSCTGTTAVQAG